MPAGGLAPLPGIVQSAAPAHTPLPVGPGAFNLINGFFVAGPINSGDAIVFPDSALDSIIVGQLAHDVGNNLGWYLDDFDSADLTSQNSILSSGASLMNGGGPCTMTGALTRANPNPDLVGALTWFLEYWYTGTGPGDLGGSAYLICYPDPTDPTASAPYSVQSTTDATPSQALCHQNRMVILRAWQDFWSSTGNEILTNEIFCYTDPRMAWTWGRSWRSSSRRTPSATGPGARSVPRSFSWSRTDRVGWSSRVT